MKKLICSVLLLFVVVLLASCEHGKLPDSEWQFVAPETLGVNGALLDKLHSELENEEIYSVVAVKDGYIIDEYYKQGFDENSRFAMYSCTKSITSALIGIAIDKGIISGAEVRLVDYFPQLANAENEDKQAITIEHLLNQTSGISWAESPGQSLRHMVKEEKNWVDFILSQPMAAKPGAKFNYRTGNSHLLTAILQQAAGETANSFASKFLFKPIGIHSVRWSVDPQGVAAGGNGISMTTRDAARFGQLYLNGGRWGEQQVVPETWVAKSAQKQSEGQPGSVFTHGYQWWIGETMYFAQGHGGQYIFVVPELELVTVVTGNLSGNAGLPRRYFAEYIVAACG